MATRNPSFEDLLGALLAKHEEELQEVEEIISNRSNGSRNVETLSEDLGNWSKFAAPMRCRTDCKNPTEAAMEGDAVAFVT